MALPLESNVDDADEADDGGIAAMEKMLADSAKKASEKKKSSDTDKEKPSPKKSKSPKAKVNLQPDVIIEVEETEVARQKGHMVIALENPNPELEMVILVRWSRKENVPFQLLLTLLCYCSSDMVQ